MTYCPRCGAGNLHAVKVSKTATMSRVDLMKRRAVPAPLAKAL